MPNSYINDQVVPHYFGDKNSSPKYTGKQPAASGKSIGLSGKNGGKNIGLTKQSSSIERTTSKKHGGYDPNNAR